jgi:hypothetical protein
MYAGHVGIALGAKGLRKTAPLWLLIFASQMPDWADAALCFAGIRTTIPGMYSHSLPAIAILTVLAACIAAVVSRERQAILVVAALVVSHALADLITGDKATWPGGPVIGLRLYHCPMLDFCLEAVVIIAGWLIYRRSLPAERRSSKPAFALLGTLLVLQLGADIIFSIMYHVRKC